MNILVLITSSHHFSYSYLSLSEIFKRHLFKDLIKMNNVKGMLAVIHWLFHRSQIPERCINSIFNMPYTQERSFQVVLVVKNLPATAGDIREVFQSLGPEDSPGGRNSNPFRYCLENPMARGAWRVTVHGVTASWAWLKWLSTYACIHRKCPVIPKEDEISVLLSS